MVIEHPDICALGSTVPLALVLTFICNPDVGTGPLLDLLLNSCQWYDQAFAGKFGEPDNVHGDDVNRRGRCCARARAQVLGKPLILLIAGGTTTSISDMTPLRRAVIKVFHPLAKNTLRIIFALPDNYIRPGA